MSQQLVTYNGYQFNEYSSVEVSVQMQPDDSNRTILYHRYKIRVETVIYAEGSETDAGLHFRRIRERLTKQGQGLVIHHKGFDTGLFEVNTILTGLRDVAFGPKPMVIVWDPVGYENAVHVVWECELCISACNRWSGIMAMNYGISTRIDHSGYTTRTISGYIEIAMTRVNIRGIPDTADAYRDSVQVPKLPNFQREHSWNLSLDKRRADFSITDTEIQSPNAFPPGVIDIQGNHMAGWSRRQAEVLQNAIRATITLAPGQPRSRAWEIFKAIVEKRLQFLGGATPILESIGVDEQLFGNSFAFTVGYRLIVDPTKSILNALPGWLTSVGFGTPLGLNTWEQWGSSVEAIQSHRGLANLEHDPKQDQIIDMCSVAFLPEQTSDSARVVYAPPARAGQPIANKKPASNKSYVRFDTWITFDEEVPSTVQVSVAPDDLAMEGNDFDPSKPEATLGDTIAGNQVVRFVETQSGKIEIVWKGYAERIGYPIPRPDKLEIGGLTLRRVGRAVFQQQIVGIVLGQPLYRAAWNQRYVVTKRPKKMTGISGFDNNDP